MNYAIVKIGSSQYKVDEGMKLEVDKLSFKKGDKIELKEVLLTLKDDKVTLGQPFVKDALVKATVLDNIKGPKIDVYKFKAKTGYRRKMGFRSQKTTLQIENIVY